MQEMRTYREKIQEMPKIPMQEIRTYRESLREDTLQSLQREHRRVSNLAQIAK